MPDDAAVRRLEDEMASPRRILRALVLLMLEQRPSHGYDLMVRLEPLGFEPGKPSPVYRALHWLEGGGFVQSNWETAGVGPARRVYDVSPMGREALERLAPALRRRAKVADDTLSSYIRRRLRALFKNNQVFEFTVEAQLSVDALDEGKALHKVELAFRGSRLLDSDVRTAGGVSIRASG